MRNTVFIIFALIVFTGCRSRHPAISYIRIPYENGAGSKNINLIDIDSNGDHDRLRLQLPIYHDMAGVYTGHDKSSKKYAIIMNYNLHLLADQSFWLSQSFDLSRSEGTGRWTVVGKQIILEFDNGDFDNIEDALSKGKIKGRRTLKIINNHKLKMDKAILKKK